ncbi:S8 family peptidase [Streptomyces cavernae]|uniref:S8 family peptidase n=1 Tax=Streptomyces cavernae TaxID=2259034 RepID=UPI001EE3EB5B|nr:S8 family peptidase [Streptomyces cavernae]
MVTLITGDRVHVDGRGQVTRVQPAEGRTGVGMRVNRVAGQVYVLPDDAARLVAEKRVDRRLFNVTGLLKARYDDAHRASLPIIVSYGKNAGRRAEAKSAIAEADISVRRSLPTLRGEALTAPKDDMPEVWEALTAGGDSRTGGRETAAGIERVWLDGKRKAMLYKSVPQIGAPAAWQAGYDGKGMKVAVLDTGVDAEHPDLKGLAVESKDFSGSGSTLDNQGHGTHVASTVAGSGAKSGGTYKGVAPGATIISAKVLDDSGFGQDSGIVEGMQWAADQGAKIANMSLGDVDTPEVDPLEMAVERISAEKNVLFVIAAGNAGPTPDTIGSPGSAPSALTVGAVDSKDGIADFSSVGPAADGSLKPDLTAPGVDIVAARSTTGRLSSRGAPDGYLALSGTSMATPHVAGAAAILAQEHPDWSGQRIKQALTASAKPSAGLTVYQQGTGRADLAKAVGQTVVSEQTSVNFGLQQWPHTDDKPVTKQITYRNTGTKAVTLDLSLETTGPDGKGAPGGFFTLDDRQITVPAGGTASVPLAADTSVGSTDGGFTGAVVARATDGGQSVRTTFGAVREIESYDITLKFIDTEGKPSASDAVIFGHDVDFWKGAADRDGDGVAKIRVPKGTYTLDTVIRTPRANAEPDKALMVQPKLVLTENTTVTFDARKAKPVSITVPGSAKLVGGLSSWSMRATPSPSSRTTGRVVPMFPEYWENARFGQVGAPVPAEMFNAQVGGLWQKGSTTYSAMYNRTGSFYTGFTHKAAESEFALVNLKLGTSAKNRKATFVPFWATDAGELGASTEPFAVPVVAKAYVSSPQGLGLRFSAQLDEEEGFTEVTQEGAEPKTYEAGKTYTETFNVGVLSPRVTPLDENERIGDEMIFCMGEFSDSASHFGRSPAATQRSTLTVDGKKVIDEEGRLCLLADGLPAESAKFKVSTDATRSASVAGVSTLVAASWTFTSKTVTGTKPAKLPLSVVAFNPELDLTSTAKAGKKLTVPLSIQGPAAKNFKSLIVQVSYDGGKKWAETEVTTENGKRTISLHHPKEAKSVSFKAKLTDKSGNTYDVTIEKAYLLK